MCNFSFRGFVQTTRDTAVRTVNSALVNSGRADRRGDMMVSDVEEKKSVMDTNWIEGDKGETRPLLKDDTEAEKQKEKEKREKIYDGVLRLLSYCYKCCLPFLKKQAEGEADKKPEEVSDKKKRTAPVTQAPQRLSDIKEADEEVVEAVVSAEEGISAKLVEVKGGNPGDYSIKIVSYRKQVTIGVTYFVKVRLNDGPECVHARIYKPIEGPAELIGNLLFGKDQLDDIEYF